MAQSAYMAQWKGISMPKGERHPGPRELAGPQGKAHPWPEGRASRARGVSRARGKLSERAGRFLSRDDCASFSLLKIFFGVAPKGGFGGKDAGSSRNFLDDGKRFDALDVL